MSLIKHNMLMYTRNIIKNPMLLCSVDPLKHAECNLIFIYIISVFHNLHPKS